VGIFQHIPFKVFESIQSLSVNWVGQGQTAVVHDGLEWFQMGRNPHNNQKLFEPGQNCQKMARNASKWARIPKVGRQGPRWTGVASGEMNRNVFFKRPGTSGFREIVPTGIEHQNEGQK
jgi:hypothetical protein